MKNLLRLSGGLLFLLLVIFISNCKSKKQTETPSSSNITAPDCIAVCDTLGDAELNKQIITDAAYKYKKIKDWKRGKLYTLCINTTLLRTDKSVEITVYRNKVVLLRMVVQGGQQMVYHRYLKGNFTPEITIRFKHGDGTSEDADVADTIESACGAGQTVADKLKSTSTQTSTVLVTIDEKD